MARFNNVRWDLIANGEGNPTSWDQVQVALLMDIRDELQELNRVFRCHNALAIPDLLRQIKKNTTKRKYVRKPKP